MMTLKVQPNGEGLSVSMTTDTSEGGWVSGKVDERDLGERLVRAKGDVPMWLDGVWQALYS